MESLDNNNSVSGFFKHVFNFDQDSKADMLNIIQYTVLAIIPIVVVNKCMQKYVPEASEDKGNVELTLEVILQALIMFLGILFIHRIVIYVPTFSGSAYPDFNVIYVIIAVLMITLSLQTKLGEKVNILSIRAADAWNGTTTKKKSEKKENNGNVRVSQPIAGGQQMPQQMPQQMDPGQSAMNQALGNGDMPSGTTPLTNLPTSGQIPDYSNMYQDTPNPLVGAQTPGMMPNEPMAASEFGGFGSSLF